MAIASTGGPLYNPVFIGHAITIDCCKVILTERNNQADVKSVILDFLKFRH